MLVADRVDGALEHAPLRTSSRDLLGPGDLLVDQHLANAPGRAAGATRAGGTRAAAPPLDARPGRGRRRWIVELRTRRRRRPRRRTPASASSCPPAARPSCSRPTSARRLWIADLNLGEPLTVDYLDAHGRPIRYRHARGRLAARGLPERLRERAGQRRDAERRPPVHGGGDHARWSRAASTSRPVVLHTGVSSLERGERALSRALRGPRGHRRAREPRRDARAAA